MQFKSEHELLNSIDKSKVGFINGLEILIRDHEFAQCKLLYIDQAAHHPEYFLQCPEKSVLHKILKNKGVIVLKTGTNFIPEHSGYVVFELQVGSKYKLSDTSSTHYMVLVPKSVYRLYLPLKENDAAAETDKNRPPVILVEPHRTGSDGTDSPVSPRKFTTGSFASVSTTDSGPQDLRGATPGMVTSQPRKLATVGLGLVAFQDHLQKERRGSVVEINENQTLDFSGISPAELLLALWQYADCSGPDNANMSAQQHAKIANKCKLVEGYLDYAKQYISSGQTHFEDVDLTIPLSQEQMHSVRCLNVDIKGNTVTYINYERMHGVGKVQNIIDELRLEKSKKSKSCCNLM